MPSPYKYHAPSTCSSRHFCCFILGPKPRATEREREGPGSLLWESFCFLLETLGSKAIRNVEPALTLCSSEVAMEVFGKSMVAVPTNVIYLSSILGQDGPNPVHKCDWKCENELVCGNMFRCKLTALTHICDKNCNQRILYDNNSSLCRVSRQVFPLTEAEVQAVKGVRRKLDEESSSSLESCAFKRRRNAQFHPSPFEKSFCSVGPICSQVGDGMDTN